MKLKFFTLNSASSNLNILNLRSIGKQAMKVKFISVSFLVVFVFFAGNLFSQSTQLLDDFNRSNSSAVGNGWVEVESNSTGAVISSNTLLMGGVSANGREYVYQDVSARYNTVYNSNAGVLTWAFNIKQSRANPSGFDAGNYGIAYVLGCNSNNFLTGSGYAVAFGNSGTPDNIRLVKFTSGLSSNINASTVIGPTTSAWFTTEYITVEVQYNPVGNMWTLYVASSTTAFIDPTVAAFTQVGVATSDATYTGTDLLFTGCFWNHATSTTDFGTFDNVRIPSACLINPEPIVQSSGLTASAIGANSIGLNWTRGDGSECIIIARAGSAVTAVPADGATYAPNSIFGSGTAVSPGQFVVYTGSGTSATITGLNPTTNYQFSLFEFNGTGCTSNFLTTTPGVLSTFTIGCALAPEPTVDASSISITGTTANSLQLTWTRGNGAYCIVVFRAGGPISTPPVDGTAYTANSIYGLGSTTATGDFVVYSGAGNTVSVNGLMPGSTYYASVFEMNGTGCNTNYLIPGSWTTTTGVTTTVTAYNYFYGTLHAHSDYSDGDMDNICNGTGSPMCCYQIGDNAINFDFLGIADHNHNEGPIMTPAFYASGIAEATASNNAGFVSMYGMEWGTISTGGHTTVYGINKLLGWNTSNYDIYVAKGDYNSLFSLIASTPNAFATLCHPNSNDYGNIANTGFNATYDNAIVGCAVRNGPYNSTNTSYSDPSTSNFLSYWNNLLSKGYHLGPLIDMDNHNSNTMGRSSQGRTVVLASSLTRANVMDAFRSMRFYASDDYNLQVNFKVNSVFPMGSIVAQNINPTITVNATDVDGETITNIRIFYGVPGSNSNPTVLTTSASSSLTYTHSFSSGTYYYYAEITEADGNLAWTAPVWYTKTTVPLPIELLSFTGKSTPSGNQLNWITATELNNDFFTLERSENGKDFYSITEVAGAGNSTTIKKYLFLDRNVDEGLFYYRLKQTDFDGQFSYSSTIAINRLKLQDLFTIAPNPVQGAFVLRVNDSGLMPYDVRIINAVGQEVLSLKNQTEREISIDCISFQDGIYTLAILIDQQTTVKKLIVNHK